MEFWTIIERISNILQIESYELLLADSTNNEIMQKLQNQDNVLNEQTEIYLKEINKKLDRLLRKERSMYDIEENIAKIVEEGDRQEMEKLSEILEEVVYELKDYDEHKFKKYAMCIYKMANGYVLTPEMAEEIVLNMKPYGKHWTMEETTSVKNNYGLSRISDTDFYVVMNAMYNDNKSTVDKFVDDSRKIEMYVDLTKDFILDPDAKEGKVFKYFM